MQKKFRKPNPTRSSPIVLDNYPGKRGCRPIRLLYKQSDRIIAQPGQEEGGGRINGAFLNERLIDEISLVVYPGIYSCCH